jgi:hypothetical protein
VAAEIVGQPAQPFHPAAQLRDARIHRRVERRERARADDAVLRQAVAALK